MDSLTQIILGAAVGEVSSGKKIGNRALLWGAVGGTIPDLDVLVGGLFSPLQELAMHRGFSHSIVFAVMGAYIFGWSLYTLYRSKYHKYIAILGWSWLPLGIIFFFRRFMGVSIGVEHYLGLAMFFVLFEVLIYRGYFLKKIVLPKASLKEWQCLMFWSIFTHPLLDCFTTYGTQLFQPFSDYRVAFCTISVADPIYTIPFLICVILISRYAPADVHRRKWAWAGIVMSSVYLMLTAINKYRVTQIWKASLEKQDIVYQRYMTSPTILNNILWYCLAETPDGYYYGQYSLWDRNSEVDINFEPRNRHLLRLPDGTDDNTIKTLRWFSNDYYAITQTDEGGLQFNDLRFGITQSRAGEKHFIFHFPLIQDLHGHYDITGTHGGPPPGEEKDMLSQLWVRIKGK